MAKKRNNEVIVGITFTLVLALAIYIIVLLADFTRLTTDYKVISFKLPYEEGLHGLSVGSPVNLGGYKVGQVVKTDIAIPDSNAPDKIEVMFSIELPEQYRLHQDCVLIPEVSLLGGKAVLNIDHLGVSDNILAEGDVHIIEFGKTPFSSVKDELDVSNPDSIMASLKTALNREYEGSLLNSLSGAAQKLDQVANAIQTEVDSSSPDAKNLMNDLKKSVENLKVITESVRTQVDQNNSEAVLTMLKSSVAKLDDSMTGVKEIVLDNKDSINEAVKSLKNSANTLEAELPKVTASLERVIEKASTGLDTAEEALVNIKQLSTDLKDTVSVNTVKIDTLISNITEVSSNLKLVSREVRRAPWKLLYKPDQKEMEIQSTVDSAAAFAEGAERLDSAAKSLQQVVNRMGKGVADGGDKVKDMLAELENSFENFRKAEEKLWDDLDTEK